MAQRLRFVGERTSKAGEAPAHHGCLDRASGLVIAPLALDEAAGERQLVGAAVILAKHLHRLIRGRFAIAVEFSQTSFARCHVVVLRGSNVLARERFRYPLGITAA